MLQERDIGLGVISRIDALVPQDQPNRWNHGKVDRMNEVSTDQIKRAVEATRGGTATFVQSVPLRENSTARRPGVVAVFVPSLVLEIIAGCGMTSVQVGIAAAASSLVILLVRSGSHPP